MKRLIVSLLICLSASSGFSQCMPVFNTMLQQPYVPSGYTLKDAAKGITTYAPENIRNLHHTVCTKSVSGGTSYIYNLWDGSSWSNMNPVTISGTITGLLQCDGRFILYGSFNSFNGVSAPAGKPFTFLQYKGGVWDTLPVNNTVDRINYLTVTATEKNLYYANQDVDSATGKAKPSGSVFKYDTASESFVKILGFDLYVYYGPYLQAGKDRLLIPRIVKVNGTAVTGFVYIENDSIHIINDSHFNVHMTYGFDYINDHIYGFNYTNNDPFTPVINEFGNAYISTRSTVVPMSLGKKILGTGDFYGLNGDIVWDTYDAMMGSDIRLYNFLCPGETRWRSIAKTKAEWSPMNVSKDGAYVFDRIKGVAMELGYGSAIAGRAYIDLDTNCTYDSLTDVLLQTQLLTATSSAYSTSGFTDSNGYYELFVSPGNYTLSGPDTIAPCSTDTVNIIATGTTSARDIPVLRPGFYDISAQLFTSAAVRWNSARNYVAVIENHGEPYDSASFQFNLDPKLNVLSTLPAGFAISGSVVTGKVANLKYYEKRYISFNTWIDTATTKPDSVLCHNFMAYLDTAEIDSNNNMTGGCEIVSYSLDPNYKACNKAEIPVATRSLLEYDIHFQNEGNDDAYDIEIIDTLSGNVSLESFKILGSSHAYTASLNGNVLTVTFRNIFLKPKKENELLSQGFIKYSILTKNNLKDGDSITNRAAIYFDLNKPVITNWAVTKVSKDASAGIREISTGTMLNAYPNPSSGKITISNAGNEPVCIYNLTGELIIKTMPENGIAEIDLSSYTPGLYFARSGSRSCKILKTE